MISIDERMNLVTLAHSEAVAAQAQETEDGNPVLGARHYLRAVELVIKAIQDFPFASSNSQRYFLFQCRQKVFDYIQRIKLLVEAADEEGLNLDEDPLLKEVFSGSYTANGSGSVAAPPSLQRFQAEVHAAFPPLGYPLPPGDGGMLGYPPPPSALGGAPVVMGTAMPPPAAPHHFPMSYYLPPQEPLGYNNNHASPSTPHNSKGATGFVASSHSHEVAEEEEVELWNFETDSVVRQRRRKDGEEGDFEAPAPRTAADTRRTGFGEDDDDDEDDAAFAEKLRRMGRD